MPKKTNDPGGYAVPPGRRSSATAVGEVEESIEKRKQLSSTEPDPERQGPIEEGLMKKGSRFMALPRRAFDDPCVDAIDRSILLAIEYLSFGNECAASRRRIAAAARCGKSSVDERIPKLVALGYLSIRQRKRHDGYKADSAMEVVWNCPHDGSELEESTPPDGHLEPATGKTLNPPDGPLRYTLSSRVEDNKLEEGNRKPPLSPFDQFWDAYPRGRRVGKQDALRAWLKHVPSAEVAAEVMQGLERWKDCGRWRDGYVMDPSRFLNGEFWRDDGPERMGGNRFAGEASMDAFRQVKARVQKNERLKGGKGDE